MDPCHAGRPSGGPPVTGRNRPATRTLCAPVALVLGRGLAVVVSRRAAPGRHRRLPSGPRPRRRRAFSASAASPSCTRSWLAPPPWSRARWRAHGLKLALAAVPKLVGPARIALSAGTGPASVTLYLYDSAGVASRALGHGRTRRHQRDRAHLTARPQTHPPARPIPLQPLRTARGTPTAASSNRRNPPGDTRNTEPRLTQTGQNRTVANFGSC